MGVLWKWKEWESVFSSGKDVQERGGKAQMGAFIPYIIGGYERASCLRTDDK